MQLFSNQTHILFRIDHRKERAQFLMEILAHFEFGSNVAQKSLDVGQQTAWRLK